MNAQRPPEETTPKPFDHLLADSIRLYKSAFWPMVAVAAVGGLIANSLGVLLDTSNVAAVLTWTLITRVPTFVAEAVLIGLAWRVLQDEPPDVPATLGTIVPLAPQYVVGSLIIGAALLLSALTIVGIVIGLFLLARWGLFGPIMVLEQRSMTESMRRSWHLVEGRTLRTVGMLVGVQLILFIVTLAAQLLVGSDGPALARVVLATIGQALALPVIAIFVLYLYIDYLRLESASKPNPPPQP